MSELAELLADGTETVLLTQASTPIEAQLIRERIAASGGQDRPQVSLGPPGSPGFPSRCWNATRPPGWSRSGWPGCPRNTRAGGPPGWPT